MIQTSPFFAGALIIAAGLGMNKTSADGWECGAIDDKPLSSSRSARYRKNHHSEKPDGLLGFLVILIGWGFGSA